MGKPSKRRVRRRVDSGSWSGTSTPVTPGVPSWEKKIACPKKDIACLSDEDRVFNLRFFRNYALAVYKEGRNDEDFLKLLQEVKEGAPAPTIHFVHPATGVKTDVELSRDIATHLETLNNDFDMLIAIGGGAFPSSSLKEVAFVLTRLKEVAFVGDVTVGSCMALFEKLFGTPETVLENTDPTYSKYFRLPHEHYAIKSAESAELFYVPSTRPPKLASQLAFMAEYLFRVYEKACCGGRDMSEIPDCSLFIRHAYPFPVKETSVMLHPLLVKNLVKLRNLLKLLHISPCNKSNLRALATALEEDQETARYFGEPTMDSALDVFCTVFNFVDDAQEIIDSKDEAYDMLFSLPETCGCAIL